MSHKKIVLLFLCCLIPVSAIRAQEGLRLKHQLESLTGVGFRANRASDNPADILAANNLSYMKLTMLRYSFYIKPNWGLYASFDIYPGASSEIDEAKLTAPFEDKYYVTNKCNYDPFESGPTFTAGLQYRLGKNRWFTRFRVGASLYDLPPGEFECTLKGKGNNEVYTVTYSPNDSPYSDGNIDLNLDLGISIDYRFNNVIALTAEAGYRQSFARNKAYMTVRDSYTQMRDGYSYQSVEQTYWKGKGMSNEFSINIGMSFLMHKKKRINRPVR